MVEYQIIKCITLKGGVSIVVVVIC